MAPNDMSNEQRLEEHGQRLNVHAERLSEHDKALSEHQRMLGEYGVSLYGDTRLGRKGLVESIDEVNSTLHEILNWRTELIHYWRAGGVVARLLLALAGLGVAGVWWPQIQVLLKLLGG